MTTIEDRKPTRDERLGQVIKNLGMILDVLTEICEQMKKDYELSKAKQNNEGLDQTKEHRVAQK